jgi:hypothetical protein
MMRLLFGVVFACGCAHHPSASDPRAPGGSADRIALVADHALDDRECDALLDHALDLVAPEATLEDRKSAIVATRDDWRIKCRAMSRTLYRCAITAANTHDLVACDQPTRSSSTSNSNVAPGGMTPPAPRSP